jgi:hypothetical protein
LQLAGPPWLVCVAVFFDLGVPTFWGDFYKIFISKMIDQKRPRSNLMAQ